MLHAEVQSWIVVRTSKHGASSTRMQTPNIPGKAEGILFEEHFVQFAWHFYRCFSFTFVKVIHCHFIEVVLLQDDWCIIVGPPHFEHP